MRARRLSPLAPLAAACLLLSACGGGDALPPTPTASPTPSDPPGATPAAYPTIPSVSVDLAKRLAAAGVLTAADLPGWTTTTQTFDASDQTREDAVKQCQGLALTPYAARDHGRTFDKDAVEISANADVSATREQALAEMSALRSADGPRCYREPLMRAGAAEVTIEVVPATVLGADDVVAYRVTFTIAGAAGVLRGSGFQIVALVGQTEITTDTYEEVPTPTYSLERLATLTGIVAQRVRTTAAPAPTSTTTGAPTTPTPTSTFVPTSTPTPARTAF